MTSSTNRHPKLRTVDVRPVTQGGQTALLVRDPLQITDKYLIMPRVWAPVLALCDGTRDLNGIRASLGLRFGLQVEPGDLERFVGALDEAMLLDNNRFAGARERALAEYRAAPFRRPTLAGHSYPAGAEDLRQLLQDYVERLGPDGRKRNASSTANSGRGLVSPHIDYERGGPVYARVWKHAAEAVQAADLCIVFGTDHYGEHGLFTLTRQNYATPFGVLPTARDIVEALAGAIGEDQAFAGELRHRGEHSIELAAVWLHHIRDRQPCELVPILCGSFAHFFDAETGPGADPTVNAVLETLGEQTAGRRVLVVAAGDLSHVGPSFGGEPLDIARRASLKADDDEIIGRMCSGDADGFFAAIQRERDRNNVCGLSPIYMTLRSLSPVRGHAVAYERCPADAHDTSAVSVCGVVFE